MSASDRREHPTPGAKPRMAIEAHVGNVGKQSKPVHVHPSLMTGGNRGNPTAHVAPAAPIKANPQTPRSTPPLDVTYGMENTRRGPDTPGGSCAASHSHETGDRVLAEGMAHCENRLPGENHHSTTTTASIIADVKKTLG